MTDRQQRLDKAARMMPLGMIVNPIMSGFAPPELFFKTLGWYQWSDKNELTDQEKDRFREVYEEAFEEANNPEARKAALERLIGNG